MKFVVILLCSFIFSSTALALTEGQYSGRGHYGDISISERSKDSFLIKTCGHYGYSCHKIRGNLYKIATNRYRTSGAYISVDSGIFDCRYDIRLDVAVGKNSQLYLSEIGPTGFPNLPFGCAKKLAYSFYIEPAPYSLKTPAVSWSVTLPDKGMDPIFTAAVVNQMAQSRLLMQCEAPSVDMRMLLGVNDELWTATDEAVNKHNQSLKVVAHVYGSQFEIDSWELSNDGLLARLDPVTANEIAGMKKAKSIRFDITAVDATGEIHTLDNLTFSLNGSFQALSRLENYCSETEAVVNGMRVGSSDFIQ